MSGIINYEVAPGNTWASIQNAILAVVLEQAEIAADDVIGVPYWDNFSVLPALNN